MSLNRFAGMFDAAAGEKGGMRVSIVGGRSDGGGCMRRTWQLTAPAMDGPEIPCMAAILLNATSGSEENAVLPEGKCFLVYVQSETVAKGSVH